MGFRFRRSIRIFPGVRLNLSRSGISTSVGVRGARVTVGKNGTRTTVGLPGTGLSYTSVEARDDRAQAKQEIDSPGAGDDTGGSGWARLAFAAVLFIVLVFVALSAIH